MTAAIYARVSTKPKALCPVCGKIVRLVDGDRLLTHINRAGISCDGSGRQVEATADKGQDTENQLYQLREYCQRQNWATVEYVDRESAKSGERDEFKRLFVDASRRNFEVVLVWALDRFTREGVYETFDYVHRLTMNGVQFESYSETHFRTTGPAGELMMAISAWIAKQERLRISERTKAGMARAQREGKHCGRPRRVFRLDKAVDMYKKGASLRVIAAKLSVSFMTVSRALSGVTKGT